jgi:hypothetical protein
MAYQVDGTCRRCGKDPEKVYRCQECGTPEPLDGDPDDEESGDAALMTDGGLDEDELEETKEVGVPNSEGTPLGDAWVGGSDAAAARRALKDAVDKHVNDTDNGARVGTVINTAIEDADVDVRLVIRQLKLLLEQGDLYKPTRGTVKRTLADGGRAEATDREIATALADDAGAGVIAEDLQVGGAGVTYRGPGPADGGDE